MKANTDAANSRYHSVAVIYRNIYTYICPAIININIYTPQIINVNYIVF